MISNIPMNVSDIAPIFTLISTLTTSNPVHSNTITPSTHNTTYSRSRMIAKLSSINHTIEKKWSNTTTIRRPFQKKTNTPSTQIISFNHVHPSKHVPLQPQQRHAFDQHRAHQRNHQNQTRPTDP